MRGLLVVTLAGFSVWMAQPSASAAPAGSQQVRSLGECVRIANARGWNRYGEKGRLPFIKACMRGRAG
jgi:hypothetical protein